MAGNNANLDLVSVEFDSFYLLVPQKDVFVSAPAPDAPNLGRTLFFYQTGATLLIFQFSINPAMMAPLGLSPEDVDALSAVLQGPLGRSVKSEILENVFAEFELTLDESNVKPDAILACIFPELHLVGLKTQTRSEQRVAALATISDSSFMFLLSYSPDNRSHIEKELPQSIQFVLRSND